MSSNGGLRQRRSVEQEIGSELSSQQNDRVELEIREVDCSLHNQQTTIVEVGHSTAEYGSGMQLGRSSIGKKRKSDEITRDASFDIEPVGMHEHSRHGGQSVGYNSYASSSRVPTATQQSHITSSQRKRGLSLRSSLFSRNVDRSACTGEAVIEMHNASAVDNFANDSQTTKKRPQTSVIEVLPSGQADVEDSDFLPPRSPFSASSRKHVRMSAAHASFQGIKRACRGARRYLLHIHDIPPSKDGRHIDIDPRRATGLIDERTGHPYMPNYIKSSKYTIYNFLPRQLFAQFSKLANAYFLCVSILQMIPGLSTTGTYTTIIPLMFFISISMAKEGYEDFRRHRLDKEENTRLATVLRRAEPMAEKHLRLESGLPQSSNNDRVEWTRVKWQSLQVGDIVRLRRDELIPADVVLLHSQGPNTVAYVETMALDGETNLKPKFPPAVFAGTCNTLESIASIAMAEVVVEDPNLDLYNFEGKVVVNDHEAAPLTNTEIVYRGSVLRNTTEVIAVIVYAGEECKIRKNANRNPRIKAPSLQAMVNKIVLGIVVFVVTLAISCTLAYRFWFTTVEDRSWYLTQAIVNLGHIFISFVIMFNTLIPLSLYVSLEIIKVAQMFLLNDVDMYDEASNTPFEARTSTINEELGQVSYVFSDKTGTLTENVMRVDALSIAGKVWGHARSEDTQAAAPSDKCVPSNKEISGSGPVHVSTERSTRLPMVTPKDHATPYQLSAADLIEYIQHNPSSAPAQRAKLMLISMALCHTCLPEREDNSDAVRYQAASPDELALVQAAAEMGFAVYDRAASIMTLKTYPNGRLGDAVLEMFEILDVIEFSSYRKRMSVVVRMPDRRICVMCKGADSVVQDRLRLAETARRKVAEAAKIKDERRSLDAQRELERRSCTVERRESSGSFLRTSFQLASRSNANSPRPSAQFVRKSLAYSDRHNSIECRTPEKLRMDDFLLTDAVAIVNNTFQHINDFATTGLRTLLYGHRFLDEEEYCSWKGIYHEATTSLIDRQAKIERAAELIEQQLELTGATAIEDKLQSGVPETIESLREANIKLWMLTGDKRETAINIGHSCHLIKELSVVTILDSTVGNIEHTIASTTLATTTNLHTVLVIDGHTLTTIQASQNLHDAFLSLAILADSVICCRASPSQKASLVHSIRRRVAGSVTLAIGDGANDIAMIQEAHVGIGITGKEGLQAARASDYSIARFGFLRKLLLVHGRWNYVRTCRYVLATFWKELLFYLSQALYQHWNGYTGTSLYEPWSLSMFNTLFTSLPVILLGIFEQDLSSATLLANPHLYTLGQRHAGFNFRVYLAWMFMAACEAVIVFFTIKGLYGDAIFSFGQDLFSLGDACFTSCVVLINIKIQVVAQRHRTWIAGLCLFIEIGGWFLWNTILSLVYKQNNEYDAKYGFTRRFGNNALWWLAVLLAVSGCLIFEVGVQTVKNWLRPTDVEVYQELEREWRKKRRRVREERDVLDDLGGPSIELSDRMAAVEERCLSPVKRGSVETREFATGDGR